MNHSCLYDRCCYDRSDRILAEKRHIDRNRPAAHLNHEPPVLPSPSMWNKQQKRPRKLSLRGLLCIPRLVLGNDGAVGAGICAGTAVQASTSVDDVLIVTLRNSTSGASVGASAAADACRSNLVCHGIAPPLELYTHCSTIFLKSKGRMKSIIQKN